MGPDQITTHLSMTARGIPAAITDGMIDAIDSEKFEHCLPDKQAVSEKRTWDIADFFIGMRALSDQPAAQ